MCYEFFWWVVFKNLLFVVVKGAHECDGKNELLDFDTCAIAVIANILDWSIVNNFFEGTSRVTQERHAKSSALQGNACYHCDPTGSHLAVAVNRAKNPCEKNAQNYVVRANSIILLIY